MQKSIELIHLEYLHIRQNILTSINTKKLKNLTRGFQGEAEFLIWLVKYGSEHLKRIHSYWFHTGKAMESDFLIITKDKWYTIDVKNFDGYFEYKNNECWLNNWLMDENFMVNMSTRVRKLQRIAHEVDRNIEVIGAMVFINEHNEVKINGEIDFDIVLRHQLRLYLSNIHQSYPLNLSFTKKIDTVLDRYRTDTPFKPTGLLPSEFINLRKGLTCLKCRTYNLNISRKNINCLNCGHSSTKSESVHEAIRQLRYIFCDNPEMITVKNLLEFTSNNISRRTLIRALTSKYQRISYGKNAYYHVDLD